MRSDEYSDMPTAHDARRGGAGETASYRRARPDDAKSISDVLLAAFKPYEALYTDGGFAATAIQPSEVEQRMREGPAWVAEVDGEIVGTVSAVVRDTALYVRGMAVMPCVQRRGIGDRLLEEAERFAVICGSSELELSTTPFLFSARALYERHGFQYVGDVSSLHGTPLFSMRKLLSPMSGVSE
jgi:GNAT superfamily N-acetyltransferase